MPKTEQVVLTNMCMIQNGSKVLVQDSQKIPEWSGLTFPGGHVEIGESFIASTIREVYEETGLTVSNLKLCGVKQFTMAQEGYRYIVFLYRTETFSGELRSSSEGEVFWLERADLDKAKLVPNFHEMLAIFESEDLSENYIYLENDQRQSKNW